MRLMTEKFPSIEDQKREMRFPGEDSPSEIVVRAGISGDGGQFKGYMIHQVRLRSGLGYLGIEANLKVI